MTTQGGEGRITGPAFRARREALGLSVAETAVLAGVGTGVVDKFEREKSTPTTDSYYSLLGVVSRLEKGETLVVSARVDPDRGGGVVLAVHQPADPARTVEELTRLVQRSRQDDQ